MFDSLRTRITAIDSEILALIEKRQSLTHEVGIWKKEHRLPLVDLARERDILMGVAKQFPLDQTGISSIWREIMYMSKREQFQTLCWKRKNRRIGIQGWRGSFNEIAIKTFLRSHGLPWLSQQDAWDSKESEEGEYLNNISSLPHGKGCGLESVQWEALSEHFQNQVRGYISIEYLYTTEAVLESLNNGSIDYGQFAIANSIGGLVDETITSLGRYRFRHVTHYEIPIIHALMKHPDAIIDDITTIMGHDQALRQCEQTLAKWYPSSIKRAGTDSLTDNASIAEAVAQGKLPNNTACIGHASLAEIYWLTIIQENIQDRNDNRTTFVLVEC